MHTDFYPFPSLSTNRLLLRELQLTDDVAIQALRSNADVNTYLERPAAIDLAAARQFITSTNNRFANAEGLYWVITTPSSSQLMGTICLWNYQPADGSVEIGYELMPKYQRQGFMQEAIAAVITFAFTRIQANVIKAEVDVSNQPSIKALQKHGFTEIPHQRLHEILHFELRNK
ncbi:ribosomal-protein-alanine N-acetyltransferase [Chitinophaga jiangningensis]|uniref:Ribosomal-protein-alanine N-acetyltransferase n=1 Tax=Chitinophaga jiangningensis TaxID=1419482 RepID=A0A1M6Y2W7_9BACT|nr:GNAT family N-acetyltransferase [Chitinophaga jiangningensis]SHL12552.1 ribosomal-protein-alanine N-acetyltransferase [Chitinophaga jiangningensis]